MTSEIIEEYHYVRGKFNDITHIVMFLMPSLTVSERWLISRTCRAAASFYVGPTRIVKHLMDMAISNNNLDPPLINILRYCYKNFRVKMNEEYYCRYLRKVLNIHNGYDPKLADIKLIEKCGVKLTNAQVFSRVGAYKCFNYIKKSVHIELPQLYKKDLLNFKFFYDIRPEDINNISFIEFIQDIFINKVSNRYDLCVNYFLVNHPLSVWQFAINFATTYVTVNEIPTLLSKMVTRIIESQYDSPSTPRDLIKFIYDKFRPILYMYELHGRNVESWKNLIKASEMLVHKFRFMPSLLCWAAMVAAPEFYEKLVVSLYGELPAPALTPDQLYAEQIGLSLIDEVAFDINGVTI